MKPIILLLFLATTAAIAIDQRMLHQSTMARYSAAKEDFTVAKKRYTNILTTDHAPIPKYVYHGYLRYLDATGRHTEIITIIPTIEKNFDNDPDTLLLMAQAHAAVGNTRESNKRVIDLVSRFKDHQEIVFHAAHAYLQNKEPHNALTVLEVFLNTPPHRPNDRIFYLIKSQIHLQLDQYKDALDTIQTCLDLYPTFDRGWLMYGMLHEQKASVEGKDHDGLNQALRGYSAYLELTDQPNKEIEQHVLRLALKKSLRSNDKYAVNTARSCLEQAMIKFNNKEYSSALASIESCLNKNPRDTDGRLMKVQILNSMNRAPEASAALKQWCMEEPTIPLWFETLHLLCRSGLSYTEAYTITADIAQKHPDSLIAHLYVTEYATRMHDTAHAIAHGNQALALTHDPQLQVKLSFHLGMLYYKEGSYAKAIDILEKGASLGLQHAPLHNLLAYCYAAHVKDLAKAQQHIAAALQSDPHNPYYLDTQAVILYEQQEYVHARDLLEKALSTVHNDSFILEHLAKTLYKQGNIDDAQIKIDQAYHSAQSPLDKERISHLMHSWKKK